MNYNVVRVTCLSDPLVEAFGRLLPQLSERLANPQCDLLQAVVAGKQSALFAAESAGEIVGLLTLVWYDVPSGRKAWIEDVVVDQAFRGAGVGGLLVEKALEWAAKIGADKVMLTSNPSRQAAHRLYRRAGFSEVETTLFAKKRI